MREIQRFSNGVVRTQSRRSVRPLRTKVFPQDSLNGRHSTSKYVWSGSYKNNLQSLPVCFCSFISLLFSLFFFWYLSVRRMQIEIIP
jgi:hypothetical protein